MFLKLSRNYLQLYEVAGSVRCGWPESIATVATPFSNRHNLYLVAAK